MDNKVKNELRGGYAEFLRSPSGQDFIKQSELLEKAFILQGIKSNTNDERAAAITRLEGLVALRDYMVRMSKPAK